MKIVDIATEIFTDLDQPSTTSIPAIAGWLRNNIGKLNILIASTYAINTNTLEFDADLGETEKAIYKKLYNIFAFGGTK